MYVVCFSMVLLMIFEGKGIIDVKIEIILKIGLDKDGDGFVIKFVVLIVKVSGIGDKVVIEEVVKVVE